LKVQVRIDSLVHGGEGLGRQGGRVVFIPGAAPGDLVEAEVSEQNSAERFLRGRLLRVLETGPSRVPPPCPIVDRCGGCPLQHVSSDGQAAAKADLVADALQRIGGFERGSIELGPLVASPKAFQYRRRARLHRAQAGQWGFAGHATSQITAVAECLLFEPALQELADRVRAAAAELGGLPEVLDLGLDVSDQAAGSLDLRTEKSPTPALRKRATALLAAVRGLRGLTMGPSGAPELIGDPVIVDAPGPDRGGARFRTRADLFAQANRSATPLLVQAALEGVGEAAKGRVLELYCGSGTFTLPLLARAGSVVAAEGSAASLSLLRKSAVEVGLDQNAALQLIAGDATKIASGLAASGSEKFDAILLDPPRTGAAGVLRAISSFGAQRIVYVSCDAPTFARDAKALGQAGYRLEKIVPFDLFPQTAHLELVATFGRL